MTRILGVALAVLVLSACSSSDAPRPTTGELRVANASSVWVDELYVARSDAGSWGVNQVPDGLASSTLLSFEGMEPAAWDVMAIVYGSGTDYYAYATGQTVIAGAATTVTLSDSSFSGTLKVYNGDPYSASITELYVVPASAATWGNDQLGGDTIPVGTTLALEEMTPGLYDVFCQFDEVGVSDQHLDVSITSLHATTVDCNPMN